MKKEDLIKLGLDEEIAQTVADAFAEYLKGFIPKSRFDEVNEAKKKLEQDIKTRDEQLEALKKIDAEGLQAEIEKLQKENKATKEKYEAELKQIRLNNAVEKKLIASGAKNIKATKALLDLESVELDEDGNVKGLDEQIKQLQENEDSKFLFDIDAKSNKQPQFKGFNPGERKDTLPGESQPSSLFEAVKMHFSKE
mgnify:CR=1 FL=1